MFLYPSPNSRVIRIKEGEIGRACNMHGGGGKTESNRLPVRHRYRWQDNMRIKMNFN